MTAKFIPAARMAQPYPGLTPRRLGALLTATAAALSVVLATALPARASPDTEDMLKTLLGLAIIGAIAQEAGKDSDRDRADNRYDPPYKPLPTHKPPKKKGNVIPSSCAIQISGKKRDAVVYPESCLHRAGIRRNLPYQCSNEARIYGKWDTIFSEQCLRSAGFRLEGTRKY